MNPLAETIRTEIARAGGAIPFAHFMERALYCPLLGYYERKRDIVGCHGDYYTSVSVGPLFGELLAFQFADWLEQLDARCSMLAIAEAGAHDGRLAADILRWLRQQRPRLFKRLQYLVVEPSAQRRGWQRETLREFEPHVRWLPKLADAELYGVLFSNELLDAMPVHRLGWDAKQKLWFEWGVAAEDDRFVWTRLDREPLNESADSHVRESQGETASLRTKLSALQDLPKELLGALPDGFTTEVCPAAESWWQQAANSITAGKLVTIDYGLTAGELFRPEHRGGTLRAYHQHHIRDDLLANVGEQDLTAHVNFTALQRVGETAGLATEGLLTQPQFLTQIAERVWKQPGLFGEWTAAHNRQFQTLTHPEHLGRAFRTLVQSK
jgi:SAM-dependent MidA family methyltransferase